jgi:hypothetical protein
MQLVKEPAKEVRRKLSERPKCSFLRLQAARAASMIRRLALDETSRVRNPGRHIKALQLWANRFQDWFPPKPDWNPVEHWHPPIDQRLTRPATTSPAIQRQVAAALLAAAANLLAAKPCKHERAVVAALLDTPDLFGSEVQVFFDEAYFQRFTADDVVRTWSALPANRSLAGEMGFSVPHGLFELGFHCRVLINEPDAALREYYEHEVWWYPDRLPAPSANGLRTVNRMSPS